MERVYITKIRRLAVLHREIQAQVKFDPRQRHHRKIGLDIVPVVIIMDQQAGIMGIAEGDVVVVFLSAPAHAQMMVRGQGIAEYPVEPVSGGFGKT